MHRLSLRAPAALLTLGLASLVATPASAGECTYTDLHGTFSVTTDCEGLKDHSNLGNEQKRMWLAGDWGQVNIIEVPSPYKQDAGQLDLIMSNLGKIYTERRSPGGVQETTVAGQDARVIIEHKMRTSSRSWVFHWQGRNLIMRAVAYGKKKQRMENLDAMSAALTSTFAEASGPVAKPEMPKTKSKVRDRAPEAPAAQTADEAKKSSKDRAMDAKGEATEMADDAEGTATEMADEAKTTSKDRAMDAKESAADVKDEAAEMADDAKGAATEMADDAKKGSKARATDAKDGATEAAEDAADTAEDAADTAEEAADDAVDTAEEKATDAVEGAAEATQPKTK